VTVRFLVEEEYEGRGGRTVSRGEAEVVACWGAPDGEEDLDGEIGEDTEDRDVGNVDALAAACCCWTLER